MTLYNRPMSDKRLQRVTVSVSYIGQPTRLAIYCDLQFTDLRKCNLRQPNPTRDNTPANREVGADGS